jgi:glycosyltransferase involved in cell wall biosynthesis
MLWYYVCTLSAVTGLFFFAADFWRTTMKKVAIVANDIAMPGEKGLNRLRYFAELLSNQGYDVEVITADFQHWSKQYRTKEDMERINKELNCHVTFIHENSYTKNIDIKRFVSYSVLTKNVKKHLEQHHYDLCYALIPDNHLAATVGRYAKKSGIPFIVDVEDLWPEAMRMVLDVPVVSDVFFSCFSVAAKHAYKLADAVVGSSDEYRDEPLKYGVRVPKAITVYVGNVLADFDKGVKECSSKIEKSEGEFWVTYAGTLGTSYDIATFVKAVGLLNKKGYKDIKAVLLGDGPLRKDFELAAKNADCNVLFTGYLDQHTMAAYLAKSDVTLNSLVSKASQSIVSKIGDYLAAGVPMINTGLNKEFCKKVNADGFGVNVAPENVEALADAILSLYNDREKCEKMGLTARKIAEEQFDRPVTYMKIVDLIRGFIG